MRQFPFKKNRNKSEREPGHYRALLFTIRGWFGFCVFPPSSWISPHPTTFNRAILEVYIPVQGRLLQDPYTQFVAFNDCYRKPCQGQHISFIIVRISPPRRKLRVLTAQCCHLKAIRKKTKTKHNIIRTIFLIQKLTSLPQCRTSFPKV